MFSLLSRQLHATKTLQCTIFTAGLLISLGISAATLTITDDNGEKAPLEIQANDYVRFTAASDGDLFLVLKGFSVSIDNADGSSASSDDSSSDAGGATGSDDTAGNGDGASGDSDDTSSDTDETAGDDAGSSEDGGSSSDSDEESSDNNADVEVPTEGYCAGFDPDLADCNADNNFDPWIAGTGEVSYWIRNRLTEVFPFTLPERSTGSDAEAVWYGYLQMTTGERKRDRDEDVFHAWFSETPNGPVIEGTDCEWYAAQARGNVYWTQDESMAGSMCFLGTASRVLYVNFETRCYEKYYNGTCDDANKRKSSRKYQFDVSRRFRKY